MICPACSHEQETGKFCVKCGTKLEEKNQEIEDKIEAIENDPNTKPLSNADVEVKVQDEEAEVDEEVVAKNLAQEDIEVTEEEIHKAETPLDTPVTPSANQNEAPHNEQQPASTSEAVATQTVANENQNPVHEQPSVTQSQQQAVVQPNPSLEKVKAKTKNYWEFVVDSLKNPNRIFETRKKQFTNGLISAGIFTVAFMLTLLIFVWRLNSDLGPFGRSFGEILGYALQGFVFIAIAFIVVAALLLLFTKLFSPNFSFQEIITVYGTMLLPMSVLFILPIFIGLIGEFEAASSILALIIFISLYVIPLFILGRALFEKSVTINPLYTFVIYFVTKVIVFSIIFKILEDTTIGSMRDFLVTFF